MRKSQDDDVGSSKQSVALIVGATGMVGRSLVDIFPRLDTPGGPWKVYALSRGPPTPWFPPPSSWVTRVLVDLTDPAAVAEALAPLADITHVFYTTWSPRATEADNRETNSGMLRNVLSAVGPKLAHVFLQTGTKHYMRPFDAVGEVAAPEHPYTEDTPRRSCPNFYYDQEDILFDEVSRRRRGGADVSWSVHRPSIINGVSPRSFVNNIRNLCVYAAIFDLVFGSDWLLLDSMNKSKEHGFLGFRNTVKSFDSWIYKMKAYKIVP